MADDSQLQADEWILAMRRIAEWRADADAPIACPRCGLEGLVVIDRSARPYAEWYHLTCAGCTLDASINIPLGPPVAGGLD